MFVSHHIVLYLCSLTYIVLRKDFIHRPVTSLFLTGVFTHDRIGLIVRCGLGGVNWWHRDTVILLQIAWWIWIYSFGIHRSHYHQHFYGYLTWWRISTAVLYDVTSLLILTIIWHGIFLTAITCDIIFNYVIVACVNNVTYTPISCAYHFHGLQNFGHSLPQNPLNFNAIGRVMRYIVNCRLYYYCCQY